MTDLEREAVRVALDERAIRLEAIKIAMSHADRPADPIRMANAIAQFVLTGELAPAR